MQEPSYTAIPNYVVDELMRELTASEFCLFMIVFRKTIGWHKDQDAISTTQFMSLSGQSKPTVLKALKGLIDKKILWVIGEKAQTKIYSVNGEILNMCHSASKETLPLASKETLPVAETTSKESLRTSKETLPLASKESLHTKETTKETIQKKERQRAREDMFDQFWNNYPKRQGKKTARDKFLRIAKLEQAFPKIMQALEKQKTTEQWKKESGRFVPNPATWINQERWDDEIPTSQASAPNADLMRMGMAS